MKRLSLTCLFFLLLVVCLAQPQVNSDSLKRTIKSSLPIDQRIKAYQSMIISLWLNYPDSADAYARQALRESMEEKSDYSQSIANRMMGGVQLYKGNYDSALRYNKKANGLALKINNTELIASSYNNLGFTLYHMGSYIESINTLLKALKYGKQLKNHYGVGLTYDNLGLNYTQLKDYDKARSYLHTGLNEAIRFNDKNVELYSDNLIGFTYLLEKKYVTAEEYFDNALEIAKQITNNNWHATTYSGLGQIELAKGNDPLARTMFKKSLQLREEIGERTGISEIYYFMSVICFREKKIDSAFYFLRTSERIATKIKAKGRQMQNYALFKDLFYQRKQYDSSLYYLERYTQLNNNLFNETLARSLSNLEVNILDEENKQALAEKELLLQKRNTENRFLIALMFVILFFALAVTWFYRMQKKLSTKLVQKNSEISSQREEIAQQREELLITNDRLKEAQSKLEDFNKDLQSTVEVRTKDLEQANRELKILNHEMDDFIYKSSHDMKGPLVRLLGICHVALMDVEDKKSKQYFDLMKKTSLQINDIFDRLKTVVQINNLEIRREKIYFDLLIEKIKKRLKMLQGCAQVTFDIQIDQGIDYYSDEFLVETIFTNLMENAVKFQKNTEEHKFVRVHIRQNDQIQISFSDNGIGIKESDRDHLFEMFSKNALEHHNVGLGLYIVRQSVKKLNGSIQLTEGEDVSTNFVVSLPIS